MGYGVAIDSLLLVVLIAPVAVYFLFLGLVNSHARPCLVSSRSDFVALTVVMAPLLVAPMPALARGGYWWAIGAEAALAGWGFLAMLPGRRAGWVIYNISPSRGRGLIQAAVAELGWDGHWSGDSWRGRDGALYLTSLSLLRNVTIHADLGGAAADSHMASLNAALSRRLARIEQLPSTMGAFMLLLGVALLALPIWTMGRHIQDVVEAVIHLFG